MPNHIRSDRRSFCLFSFFISLKRTKRVAHCPSAHIAGQGRQSPNQDQKSSNYCCNKQPGNACVKGKIGKGGKQGRKGGRARRAGLLYWRTGAVDEAP